MFDIADELKKLPDCPGVYLHKNIFGQVIYVGKAISLKKRVRQYFQASKNQTPKVKRMVQDIAEFEYISCGSEMEALVLECNLIKSHKPYYNILLRDDKSYPYLKLTLNEKYPRLIKTHKVLNDKARYFGPYPDGSAVNAIMDFLNDYYHLKRCTALSFSKSHTPCLNFHVKRCKGICQNKITEEEYKKNIDSIIDFLQGKSDFLKNEIENRMNEASENLHFEEAAVFRNYLFAINSLFQKQRVVLEHQEDIDIILIAKSLFGFFAMLFNVRAGKLLGRENFYLGETIENEEELYSEFIKQYYSENTMIPKEIMLDRELLDAKLLQEWLSSLAKSNVALQVPKRGEKKALLELVQKDVEGMQKDLDDRASRILEKEAAILKGFSSIFGEELAKKIHRIESYDISNLNGLDCVGSMVVFCNGKAQKQAYRRFEIKTNEGGDAAYLTEMLFRRFRNAKEKQAAFSILPDLILMDGGIAQVNAAKDVLKALQLDILVAGMIKNDKHRTRAILYEDKEYSIKEQKEIFAYIGNIQEEVHRFAIDYHNILQNKKMRKSVLDDIKGIGEKRKTALLEQFGSIEAIKTASVEDLSKANGLNLKVAENIHEYFEKRKD